MPLNWSSAHSGFRLWRERAVINASESLCYPSTWVMDGDRHTDGRGQDLYEPAGDGLPADPGHRGIRLPVSHSRQGSRPAVRASIHRLLAYVIRFWQAITVMDKGASAQAPPAFPRRLAICPARRLRCGPSLTALIALVALISALLPAHSSAGINRWATSGPAGENVNSLAIDPSAPATLYAGTLRGGVFKSSDGSQSWRAVNAGLTSIFVNALAVSSQDVVPVGVWLEFVC
jgi:hypothetical protein